MESQMIAILPLKECASKFDDEKRDWKNDFVWNLFLKLSSHSFLSFKLYISIWMLFIPKAICLRACCSIWFLFLLTWNCSLVSMSVLVLTRDDDDHYGSELLVRIDLLWNEAAKCLPNLTRITRIELYKLLNQNWVELTDCSLHLFGFTVFLFEFESLQRGYTWASSVKCVSVLSVFTPLYSQSGWVYLLLYSFVVEKCMLLLCISLNMNMNTTHCTHDMSCNNRCTDDDVPSSSWIWSTKRRRDSHGIDDDESKHYSIISWFDDW